MIKEEKLMFEMRMETFQGESNRLHDRCTGNEMIGERKNG